MDTARRAAHPALIGLATLAGAGVVAACSHHVRLVMPDTTSSSKYVCPIGTAPACTPDPVDVPEDNSRSGTTFVRLPRQCQGRISEILVVDADTSEPKIHVTCAAHEEPVGEMGPPAPRSPLP